MDNNQKTKQLLKILISVAWIDGNIQAEERKYLHDMVSKHGFNEDPEIKLLLSEIKPIKPQECYKLVQEYLGDNHTQQDTENLLETISGLIYSDGNVELQEAELLTKLIESGNESPKSPLDKVITAIQKLYRQSVYRD